MTASTTCWPTWLSPASTGPNFTPRMRSTILFDATCYSGLARATARQRAGIEDASPAAQPSASFLTCGARALFAIAAPLPLADEPLIGLLGMASELDLAVAQLFD